MKWNLRLAAANRGIWKASEFQRMLAERGLVISAGKMSGLWSGNPNVVKLDELDIICAVLGCGVEELLIPEPDTVAAPPPAAEDAPAVVGLFSVAAWLPWQHATRPAPAGRLATRSSDRQSPRAIRWVSFDIGTSSGETQ